MSDQQIPWHQVDLFARINEWAICHPEEWAIITQEIEANNQRDHQKCRQSRPPSRP